MLNFRKIFIYIATTGRSVKSKGWISSMYHSNRSVIPVLCYSSCLITLLFSWPDVSFCRALMCLSSSILKWLEMPLWRAVSVGIYSVVSDWNQHHSRRISTNHQLQWRKGARNILVKSPQYHVTYLSAMKGCDSWYLFGCWWAMYSWTTFKSTRLLCTMRVSRSVKALWSFSILQLLLTKKWRKI